MLRRRWQQVGDWLRFVAQSYALAKRLRNHATAVCGELRFERATRVQSAVLAACSRNGPLVGPLRILDTTLGTEHHFDNNMLIGSVRVRHGLLHLGGWITAGSDKYVRLVRGMRCLAVKTVKSKEHRSSRRTGKSRSWRPWESATRKVSVNPRI